VRCVRAHIDARAAAIRLRWKTAEATVVLRPDRAAEPDVTGLRSATAYAARSAVIYVVLRCDASSITSDRSFEVGQRFPRTACPEPAPRPKPVRQRAVRL